MDLNRKTVVTVNLMGGIGNQLFQVAAGYAYSEEIGCDYSLDAWGWTGGQGRHGFDYQKSIFKNFEFAQRLNDNDLPPVVIKEEEFNYNPLPKYDPLGLIQGTVNLQGYFQSLKYFNDYAVKFKDLLMLPSVDHSWISEKNVAFHIRRGDYLHYSDIHHVCKTDYFDRCFEIFRGYQINVFTDSPSYVLDEFKHQDFNLIHSSSELNDLTLISLHDNVVCSNSSFSWWSSYLGKSKEKIIVPSKWFADGRECSDIYRDEFNIIAV